MGYDFLFTIYWYMKMFIDNTQLKSLSARALVPLECLNCQKTHYRTKNLVLRVLGGDLKNTEKASFCTRKCYNEFKFNECTTTILCTQCSSPRRIYKKELLPTNFCSKSCSAKYWNARKTTGCRRSKLEKWIEKQLTLLYPNIHFDFNKTNTINAELDIYIPSLKLAFELNGIFHYEPIYGIEKLGKTQTNDNRKFQACLEHGIELCIIDTTHQRRFDAVSSKTYLNIIVDIIKSKLEP